MFNFEDMKKQNWVGTDKDYKDAKTIAGCDELVEQFAWELNVETQLALNLGFDDVVHDRAKEIQLAGQWGINDLDVSEPPPATKKRKAEVAVDADKTAAQILNIELLGRGKRIKKS
jgi:hypothetical protein